jgi:hypothetical protein
MKIFSLNFLSPAEALMRTRRRCRKFMQRVFDTMTAGIRQRIDQVLKEMHQQNSQLKKEIHQRDEALTGIHRRDEALTAGIQQRVDQALEEMRQQNGQLKKEIHQRDEALTAGIQQRVDQALEEIQQRVEKWTNKAQQREKGIIEKMQDLRQEVRNLRELSSKGGTKKSSLDPDFEVLSQVCLKHLLPIHSPLVLISQIQRSGGTLLSQLFDGHSQCHAHPYELHVGHLSTSKFAWPVLNLNDSPEQWFATLFESASARLFQESYHKYGPGMSKEPELFPFIFLPFLQEKIFLHCLANTKVTSEREVFDAYMTSYFNAWLNNQNMRDEKKIITAFRPGMATDADSVGHFFDVYPDGKLISVLRDPQSWYVSARIAKSAKVVRVENESSEVANGKRKNYVRIPYASLEDAIDVWKGSTQALLRNKQKYGERVCLVGFADLVRKTEPVMRYLAQYVGIQFEEILLTPTFNKLPIKANSSYPVNSHGVIEEPVTRYLELLTQEERETIENLTSDLYASALQEVAKL